MPNIFQPGERVRYIRPNMAIRIGLEGTVVGPFNRMPERVLVEWDEICGAFRERRVHVLPESLESIHPSIPEGDRMALEQFIEELNDAP